MKVGLYCNPEDLDLLKKFAVLNGYSVVGRVTDSELYHISSEQSDYDLILYKGKSLLDFMESWDGFKETHYDTMLHKQVPCISKILQEQSDSVFVVPTTALKFQCVPDGEGTLGVICGYLLESEKDALINQILTKAASDELLSDFEFDLLEEYETTGDINAQRLKMMYHMIG